jgi:hypothetical protein
LKSVWFEEGYIEARPTLIAKHVLNVKTSILKGESKGDSEILFPPITHIY